ncbi:MAG TPA: hypothetical protein VEA44_00090 [Caulobacter sp.]|nr:hypothetical protein [Caulobacter sp.]
MPPPSNDRIAATDVAAILERVAGADLAARGAINIISVDAVRAKVGERWERNRSGVWAYVQRRMAEHLQPGDLFQRIGETDFLVAMTSEQGVAAQAITLRILEEVLTHFLGEASPAHMKIRTVTSVTGDELHCAPLDPRVIAVARRREDAPDSPHRAGISASEEARRNPVSFVTASGARLQIAFAVEHLVSLRHQVTAALRIEPTVTDLSSGRVISSHSLTKLSDSERIRIDEASIHYCGLFLRGGAERSRTPLILPASFRTMMASKGRGLLIAAAGKAPDMIRTGLLVELVDVDRGTPPGRLVEVVGLLRTLTRGVFVRGGLAKDALEPLRGARLAGVTLDAGDLAGDPSRLAAALLDFGRQARGLAPALAVQGLPAEDYFAVADVAGMTHAAVRAEPAAVARSAA